MSTEYVKLDLHAADYAAVRDALASHFVSQMPNNNFSENVKADGSVSWCKCAVGHGVTGAAIIDTVADFNAAFVVSEVETTEWLGAQ